MIRIEGRFELRLISAAALAQYMTYRGFTVRSLADKVDCSHSTIGHLRTGYRKTCKDVVAIKIEKALDAPKGSLFIPSVSRVAREVGQKKAA